MLFMTVTAISLSPSQLPLYRVVTGNVVASVSAVYYPPGIETDHVRPTCARGHTASCESHLYSKGVNFQPREERSRRSRANLGLG